MEKTKEEKRGQFQRLEGEIRRRIQTAGDRNRGRGNLFSGRQFVYRTGRLYSGGIIGFAQIVRTILVSYLHLPIQNFDIAGLIYYAINIPVLLPV